MKAYSKTKEKKNRKNLLALIIGLTLIACAIIITLCVTLTRPTEEPGGNVIPSNTDQTQKYVMPLKEYESGREFSDKLVYNATLNQWRTHNGVDFKAEKGSEVMAVFGGKVLGIEETTLQGIVVSVEQTDGIIAYYMSLSSDVKVNVNDVIKAGQLIGYVDSTMAIERKEGPHLHLEMKKGGEYVDPLEYLPDGSGK